MRGPCAKRRVACMIVATDGESFIGRNDCENPQEVCPRAPGEGYEKCQHVCRQGGHAEIEALRRAGDKAKGARALIVGHYWMCEACGAAMRDAGIDEVTIVIDG